MTNGQTVKYQDIKWSKKKVIMSKNLWIYWSVLSDNLSKLLSGKKAGIQLEILSTNFHKK